MKPKTSGATKLVGAAGLLITMALGWVFALGPQVSALAAVHLQIEETRSQNASLELQLSSLERQRLALEQTRSTARVLAAQFPPTADQPELFRAITVAAVDAGIGARGVTTLAPSVPVVTGIDPVTGAPLVADAGQPLARQTVSVSVAGTYAQTQDLLENLERMARAYLITSITLTAGEDEGTFMTSIAGDMYVMPPLASPEQALLDSNPTGG